MSKILELREKRAKAWEAAKAFLDAKRTQEGFVSAEDAATYDKMENDVVNLGKEIERLERQAAIDAELSKATSTPITNKPDAKTGGDTKTGRATDEYRKAFWNGMRNKVLSYEVQNALTMARIPRAVILYRMSTRRNWWKHWKRRYSSVTLQPSSRHRAVTVRSQSLHPRVRRHGSMREVSFRNLMTASDRQPSVPLSWQP